MPLSKSPSYVNPITLEIEDDEISKQYENFIAYETHALVFNLGRMMLLPAILMTTIGFLRADNVRLAMGMLWILLSSTATAFFRATSRPRCASVFKHSLLCVVTALPLVAILFRLTDDVDDRQQVGIFVMNAAVAMLVPGQISTVLCCDMQVYALIEVVKMLSLSLLLLHFYGRIEPFFLWPPFANCFCLYWQQLLKRKVFVRELSLGGARDDEEQKLSAGEAVMAHATKSPSYPAVMDEMDQCVNFYTLSFHDDALNAVHMKWSTSRLAELEGIYNNLMAVLGIVVLLMFTYNKFTSTDVYFYQHRVRLAMLTMFCAFLAKLAKQFVSMDVRRLTRLTNALFLTLQVVLACSFARGLYLWSQHSPGVHTMGLMVHFSVIMGMPQNLGVLMSCDYRLLCVSAFLTCAIHIGALAHVGIFGLETLSVLCLQIVQLFFVRHELLWHRMFIFSSHGQQSEVQMQMQVGQDEDAKLLSDYLPSDSSIGTLDASNIIGEEPGDAYNKPDTFAGDAQT